MTQRSLLLPLLGLLAPSVMGQRASEPPVHREQVPPPAELIESLRLPEPVIDRSRLFGDPLPYTIGDWTDEEQLYLEYINRARADADAEADRLAATTDPLVLNAINAFNVDLAKMDTEFMIYTRVLPPLAPNANLLATARGHSQDMFDNVFQGHVSVTSTGDTQGTRLTNAGYDFSTAGENVFSFARTPWHGHAGFNIDWGGGTPAEPGDDPEPADGMQDPPGHRHTIHSDAMREIGIGIVNGSKSSNPLSQAQWNTLYPDNLHGAWRSNVGPQLVTQNFGSRDDLDPFITGVVYYDIDMDGFYSVGEGIGGLTVRADGRTGTTAPSGGYAVPVGAGTHEVEVFGLGFGTSSYPGVVVGVDNVKQDHVPTYAAPTVNDPGDLPAGHASRVTFSTVAAATGYVVRSAGTERVTWIDGAEDGGTRVTIDSTDGYDVVSTILSYSGSYSYRLTNENFVVQSITFDDDFLAAADSRIDFRSRVRCQTPDQTSRVQVSLDGGNTWVSLYSQAGTGCSGEGSFQARSASLADYAGQSFRLRFLMDFAGGSAFNMITSSSIGWYVDDIQLVNVSELSNISEQEVGNAGNLDFTPPAIGNYLLEVRAQNMDKLYPWGPGFELQAVEPVDTDMDGVIDGPDNCRLVANADQTNTDGDLFGDACDNCPALANDDQANADSDLAGDACDGCPTDPDKTAEGICGCFVSDVGDRDGDGTLDCLDGCPDDFDKIAAGDCGCGFPDFDGDGDTNSDCDCLPGDIFDAGGGDDVLNLADWLAGHQKVRDEIAVDAIDRACADLHPGAAICPDLSPPGWEVIGDGDFDVDDLVVLRQLLAGARQLTDDSCLGGEVSAGGAKRLPGDVAPRDTSGDGLVNIGDVVAVLRFSVGLDTANTEEQLRADVSNSSDVGGVLVIEVQPEGSRSINIADVVQLLRASVGLDTIAWPARSVNVGLDDGSGRDAYQVRIENWPASATGFDLDGIGCNADGAGADQVGNVLVLTCPDDGGADTQLVNGATFRSPEAVDYGSLTTTIMVVDTATGAVEARTGTAEQD
ncbi:MAG: hypothetical protein AAF533_14270 [Acidobacteriota bacterium]